MPWTERYTDRKKKEKEKTNKKITVPILSKLKLLLYIIEFDKELLEMDLHELKIVLEKLPVNDSAILLMKYQDELSIKEIAEVLNKTESAVKMQIKRAKERAKKLRRREFPQAY